MRVMEARLSVLRRVQPLARYHMQQCHLQGFNRLLMMVLAVQLLVERQEERIIRLAWEGCLLQRTRTFQDMHQDILGQ